MIFKDNGTCTPDAGDPFGKDAPPREFRLQFYISLTLGVVAFLTFCASFHAPSRHELP
jgi:hypothetical protein